MLPYQVVFSLVLELVQRMVEIRKDHSSFRTHFHVGLHPFKSFSVCRLPI